MRLAAYIANNLDEILADWIAFAREQQPAAASLDEAALLDHAKLILREIVADMGRPQGEEERQAKSEGDGSRGSPSPSLPSRIHALQRERQGFLIEQMIAEYRALRATVFRLWTALPGSLQVDDFEDVTRFNEAIDQAIAESVEVFVVEVDKARELFLGVLSHDLRGPLSAVSASADLLARMHPEDVRPVEILLRSVAQMAALLDDLKLYTGQRLGSGFTVHVAPMRLDVFVRNTLDEINPTRGGRVLELTAVGDQQGAWDSQRLHQALSNLVFNALKYGATSAPIRIGLDGTNSDEVVLSVESWGRRIPEGMLNRIFDPLVRAAEGGDDTEAETMGGNLGLGLYVVREIASAHGGSVDVTSDDSGTRFNMRLPRFTER